MLSVGAVTAMVCAIWPMLSMGPVATWLGWAHALAHYQRDAVNDLVFRHVFGLRSALWVLGLKPSLAPLAILGVLALFRFRARLGMDQVPGILFAASALFVYAHDYDLVSTCVMAGPLVLQTRERRGLQIFALACTLAYFLPQRSWEPLNLLALSRSRELALFALTTLTMWLAGAYLPKRPEPTSDLLPRTRSEPEAPQSL